MRRIAIIATLTLVACDREGSVANDYKGAPPIDQMQMRTADWSMIDPAVGQRPSQSAILTKGPIVTDLNALQGEDAIAYRDALNARGGPLTRVGKLLVTASPPGADPVYLIIDVDQRALEAGRKVAGEWRIRRTPAAEITRPPAIEALLAG